ncbi:Arf-GAP with coiled-coil, ANK repeat and PH domain-containing protein 2 [Chelonia mydas]|uniref:Arf-GAP with coiled-coil, ANK repeat and PH domain-containing protein n=1 Tax=Chelonia mydas TaxID=8469 RepID=M7AYK8_CHEMY|nr:Arf-GAP with coiled-coil, ANK repeat and PH domain-containing protein 2 [Chelonia mydas]
MPFRVCSQEKGSLLDSFQIGSLGVHFSKVRSLTLDTWEPELLKLMCELGNDVINRIYEAKVERMGVKKPQPGSQRQEKEDYIRAKYVEKKFVERQPASVSPEHGTKVLPQSQEEKRHNIPEKSPLSGEQVTASPTAVAVSSDEVRRESLFCPDELDSLFSYFDTSSKLRSKGEKQDSCLFHDSKQLHPGLQLYRAAYEKNLPDMAEALAHGADVNWVNTEENKATPLIQAVLGGSLVTCEFLLQNGANVNHRDVKGRGPLHHGTVLGHTG